MSAMNATSASDARLLEMLRVWVQHAFVQGWVCIRNFTTDRGHIARDEYKLSEYRPTLEECLAWVDGSDPLAPFRGGNVAVLLHESNLLQADVEAEAAPPWSDAGAHPGACLSRSASGGLHAVYQRPTGVAKYRWIRAALNVDILTKGVWPLPGCRRRGDKKKAPGSWRALSDPVVPGPPPDWVLAAIPQQKDHKPRTAAPRVDAGTADAWASAALLGELASVSAAPAGEGRAHSTMMSSGARIGQIVGAGHLDREVALEQLVAAALLAGWEEAEARRCANDAIAYGAKSPRGPAEFRTTRS